jgi:hypothetical protein
VPPGVVGELCLAGVQLARGYVARPGLTAERFTPDPFSTETARLYHSGDLARWTADGVLEFLGRRDQQVKVRGHRVELGEIETVLAAHPQVTAAAVTFGRPDTGDPRLVAHVVGSVTPRALREFAHSRLPAHMVPETVLPLTDLPLTRNGKLDRALLALSAAREPAVEPTPVTASVQEPAAELLRAIWAEVLRTNQIEPDADFFAVGGHSLLAVQVVTRVNRVFGTALPVRALFDAPSLAAFARQVEVARGGTEALPPIVPAERTGHIPLSQAQQRLWYGNQLDQSGSGYVQSYALAVDGALMPSALASAVADLCQRHESLRTTFRHDRGFLEQVIADTAQTLIPLVDLSAFGEVDREALAQRLAQENATLPFDLRRGPLLRVTLLRLGAEHHVLLVAMHHIITDAWSSAVLFEELWQCYAARVAGMPPQLPAPLLQYADYTIWERRWLDDGVAMEKAASYWRQQLADAPERLDLAYDRPPSQTPVFTSKTVNYELGADETREVVRFSLREGMTPYLTALTAYLILLRMRTGQSDIMVGASTANRVHLETERMVGFFTNQLVLRTQFLGDPTVRELLARVREITLSAYAHAEMPFNQLVQMLRPGRRFNGSPLYQAEIEFHRLTDLPPGPPGLRVTRREVEGPAMTTMLDLSLHVVQTETVLRGGLAYNADVFSPATAHAMVSELRAIFGAMVTMPEARVDDLAVHAAQQGRHIAAAARASAARAIFESMNAESGADRPGRRRD